jgi:sugar lactone lactonase YvrE
VPLISASRPLFFPILLTLSTISLSGTPLVTYSVGTILENLAIAPGGNLYATDVANGDIYQVTPAGSSTLFTHVNDGLAGVIFNTDGTLYSAGLTTVYRFAQNGSASVLVNIPGAMELNGMALLAPNKLLVTDDLASTIWLVDTVSGVSKSWLQGAILGAPAGGLPFGANGIKLYSGAVYVTNTGAGTILRIPIQSDGSAGVPQTIATNLQLDDFAFGSDGSIFAAGQAGEITRLFPDGSIMLIPTGTLGDAAAAFGRTPADSHSLYVVNNGGAFLNLPDGPQAGSIVRLDTDVTGTIPESQIVPEPSTMALGLVGLILAWFERSNLLFGRSRNSRASDC